MTATADPNYKEAVETEYQFQPARCSRDCKPLPHQIPMMMVVAERDFPLTEISGEASLYSYTDPLVCRCLQVSEAQLCEARETCPLTSLCDIARTTGAGTGCTACHRRLRRFIKPAADSAGS